MAPLFLFLILSLIPLYFLSKLFKSKSRFNPPGPPTLPFIGNLHQIHPSSLHTSLWNLSKSYGPIISLRFGFIPAIVVSSASLATEVLKTQDIVFCSRPPLLGQLKLSYGGMDMAFSPYNKNWRDMRKIFTLHLLGPKRVQSFRHIREDEVSITMKNIHGLALSSKVVNMSEIMKSMTSNLMLRVSVGKSYQDGHESKEVIRKITKLQAVMAELFVSNLWHGVPFVGLVDRLLGKMDRVEKCFKYFDSFYQKLIDEHLNLEKNPKSHDEEDVIDVLLRLKKDQSFNLTYDHIKAILMRKNVTKIVSVIRKQDNCLLAVFSTPARGAAPWTPPGAAAP
ncbi:hypothetical protein OSB04_un000594 [Centaurea solstitialis]|uniref:Cytochrome P450 n=1 Tax=Centaurea solstitialis TaxID=347529 RepID=A0AA38SQ73_9ASTR|nr:hypothetical protein OSB04_un000594 [Centaurea solstitialis]